MTTRDVKMAVTGAIAAAAIVAGVLVLIRWFSGDEPGIRVKNGSIFMETVTADGFEDIGGDFDTRNAVKHKCVTLHVTTKAGCEASPLPRVKRLTITDVSGNTHAVGVFGNKIGTVLNGRWNAAGNRITHENSLLRIVSVSATGKDANGGNVSLSCSFGQNDPNNEDVIYLDARNVDPNCR